jgi:hypothetical protein
VTRVIAALLLVWEPLNFAVGALTVLPTIVYRGWVPGVELACHAGVAAIAAAGGLSLWNGGHHAVRLATVSIIAVVTRIIQSLYWSTLPSATIPGSEPLTAAVALLAGATSLALLYRTSHVST